MLRFVSEQLFFVRYRSWYYRTLAFFVFLCCINWLCIVCIILILFYAPLVGFFLKTIFYGSLSRFGSY